MQELLIRAQYRQARDTEVGGEASGRWNPLPGTQTAVQNGTAKSVVDLSVNRDAEGPVERKMEGHGKREAGSGKRTIRITSRAEVAIGTSPEMAMAKVPLGRILGEARGTQVSSP